MFSCLEKGSDKKQYCALGVDFRVVNIMHTKNEHTPSIYLER